MDYTIRKMSYDDLNAVTRLLQANAESQQGGLYGEYPLNKVEAMYQSSTNAVVALVNRNIIAVVFSFPVTYFSLPPIAQEINRRFPDITQNNWFYGPVCIDKNHRGKTLLQDLYQFISALHGGHPVAFINEDNTRSLAAHKKIGMYQAAQFEFQNKLWWIMRGQ